MPGQLGPTVGPVFVLTFLHEYSPPQWQALCTVSVGGLHAYTAQDRFDLPSCSLLQFGWTPTGVPMSGMLVRQWPGTL